MIHIEKSIDWIGCCRQRHLCTSLLPPRGTPRGTVRGQLALRHHKLLCGYVPLRVAVCPDELCCTSSSMRTRHCEAMSYSRVENGEDAACAREGITSWVGGDEATAFRNHKTFQPRSQRAWNDAESVALTFFTLGKTLKQELRLPD